MKLNHTPPNIFQDVAIFMAIGQPEIKGIPYRLPPKEVVELAIHLIQEEVFKELLPNLERLKKTYSVELMAAILDDIVDSIYVLTWAAVAFDLPLNAHWNEVQKANMAKFPSCTECGASGLARSNAGEDVPCPTCNGLSRIAIRNEFGKVQKPEGWTPPNHWQVLYEYWTANTAATQPDFIGKEQHIENLPKK